MTVFVRTEVREHIPVPYDNLFQSILSSRHADKVIFSLGSMVAQAMANGHQVVRSDVPSDRRLQSMQIKKCRANFANLYLVVHIQ